MLARKLTPRWMKIEEPLDNMSLQDYERAFAALQLIDILCLSPFLAT
jgi:hypothetical protein